MSYHSLSIENTRYRFWGNFTKLISVEYYDHYMGLEDAWVHNDIYNAQKGALEKDEDFNYEDEGLQRINENKFDKERIDFLLHLKRINPRQTEGDHFSTYVFIMNYEFFGIPCKYVNVYDNK